MKRVVVFTVTDPSHEIRFQGIIENHAIAHAQSIWTGERKICEIHALEREPVDHTEEVA